MAIGINPFEEILKESRYGKIILMTDADVDGYHICCLLLTFLYKYLKKLFHENRIYIALPPLYRVISKKGSEYLYREKELQEYFEKTLSSPKIKRYKGLGVMNEVELWNTTMNPKTRKIINLKFREDGKFDELLEILMGKDVKKRREFLLSNF